ncbi:MAG: hypothetical protein KBD53_09775 [Candidatus Omnitrophica bacterium]|nr:hypothetical protein [Candidatus Omnitrophota bacterium]
MNKNTIIWGVVCLLCLWTTSAKADSSLETEIKEMKAQFEVMQKKMAVLEEKVSAQNQQMAEQNAIKQSYEERINGLENQLTQKNTPTPAMPSTQSTLTKWIPEIGVVADVVGTLDSAKDDEEGADRVSLRELELVLGSNVDPYSRLDATISFSDTEDPSLEEAYLTRFAMPFDTTARLGKFKPKVGKVLGVHRDSLDTVDEPLVIQQYFGVEGLNKSGIDFSKTLDFPIPVTQQFTVGVLEGGNGEDGTVFGDTRRRPTIYNHLKNYLDVTDSTGMELGFSHMIGSRDEDSSFEVQVLGADATLTHNFNANQNVKLQGEVFNLSRKETEDFDGNLWGAYGLADLRLHPLWSTGFRYDYVQPVDNDRSINSEKEDRGLTGYLTFYQSEFARWRLQFTHTDTITGKDNNTAYLQGTFSIGEHKHKLQ